METVKQVTTTPEENKKILHRWCAEVFNGKKVEIVDELKVPNYADWSRFPGQAPTLESYKVTLNMFFAAFPDFQFAALDTIAAGELGLIRGVWRGTHSGSFFGLPPTGKEVSGERIDFFRFGEGKMTEHWGTGLEFPVLELMGFKPEAKAAAPGDPLGPARRFLEDVLQKRNVQAADDLLAGSSSDLMKRSLNVLALHTAFPTGEMTVEHTLREGDKVAIHSTLTGEHLGTFLGIPPTGKRVAVTKIDYFQLAGDKIVDSWHQWDNVSLLFQLGIIGAHMPTNGNHSSFQS